MSEKPDAESSAPDASDGEAGGSGEASNAESTSATRPASKVETPSPAASTLEDRPASAPTSSGGRALGGLALLVALAALALASRSFWSPAVDEAPASVDPARVEALDAGIERLNARLDEVAGRMEPATTALRSELGRQLDSEAAALRQALDELRDSLQRDPDEFEALARRVGRLEGTQSSGEASLEARMGALEQRIEQRVAALQEQLGGLGADLEAAAEERARRLALVHARALLVLGRDDWMLNADAESARAAWARAEARMASLETPPAGLVDALERLMRAAERLQGPRISERVLALERLAAAAEDWPAAPLPAASTSDGPDRQGEDPDSSGWRDRVAGAFGALVTIEALEDAPPTPLDLERARRRIAERLDAAALASAREDWSTASTLIDSAVESVRADLDSEAPALRDALERLEELRRPPASPVLPAAYDEVMDGLSAALERIE